MNERDELKRVLQRLLDDVVDQPADAYILKRGISALHRLDYGEVDPLLSPFQKGLWGNASGKVREIQAQAVGLVSVLSNMGESIGDAEDQIALAMGVDPQRLHKWRTNLKNNSTPYLTALIAHQTKNAEWLKNKGVAPIKEDILKNALSLGERLGSALQNKSKKTKP